MDLRETMKALCSECGPSGFEGPVAAKARQLIEPLCDETWIDKMGNVVGVRRCGKKNARKVLITAHLDEIGLIVTGHEDGFLRFGKIGGMETSQGGTSIRATVPLSEMFGYATDLRSRTQGRGTFTMQFARYERVSEAIQEKVLGKYNYLF